MTLVFFVGSDYTIGGLSVAGLDAEILRISSFNMRNNMGLDSTFIFCFVSAITNRYGI